MAQAYDRYGQAKDYQADLTLEYDMGGNKMTMPVKIAYRRPDGLYFNVGGASPLTIERSGSTRWAYVGAPINQYVKQTVKPGESSFGDFEDSITIGLGGTLKALDLLEGRSVSGDFVRPRLLPDATVEGNDCYVISLPAAVPQAEALQGEAKYYFDKKDLVLRLVETTITLPGQAGQTPGSQITLRQKYADVKIDSSLPDSTFIFEPPKDAKLVAKFPSPPEKASPLYGKAAPNFSVKSLAGQPLSLSSYKGKVLLLHFWASWCVPCRMEMPDLEMLYNLVKDKGVAFLGISVDAELPEATEFLQQERIALPAAFDPAGFAGAAKRYQVNAIPTTFVVDRKGVVVRAFVGMSDPQKVAEALKLAGVKVELPSGPTPSEVKRRQIAALRGLAYRAFLHGRNDEVVKELRALTDLEPSDGDAWFVLAGFLLKTSQPAVEAVNRAVRAGKSSAAAHARAAELFLEAGAEPKIALEHARAAVRLKPDSAQYLQIIGWACLQNDMLDAAVSNLEKALKVSPRYALAEFRLGQVFEKQGKKEEALRKYRVALNLDASLQEAKDAVDRLAPGGS